MSGGIPLGELYHLKYKGPQEHLQEANSNLGPALRAPQHFPLDSLRARSLYYPARILREDCYQLGDYTMVSLNWEVLAGLLRHLLTFGGGFLVTKGIFDEATLQTVIGAIITLGGAVWSVVQKQTLPKPGG